jgi:hypothetical protein
MKINSLDRVDFPLEYLYFEFSDWSKHKLFLKTNHRNWTKYLSQFSNLCSIDVLICEEEEQVIRLIIWDSYIKWKQITPGDVKKVDEKHKEEFPYEYVRKSQLYANDKHPFNLVSRVFSENYEYRTYVENMNNNVLKFEIEFDKSGQLEKFLDLEQSLLNKLRSDSCFVNRDVYVNKFNPQRLDYYLFITGDESKFNINIKIVNDWFENMEIVRVHNSTPFGYLKRESVFINIVEK